ncbi:MAG: hypothetical protein ACTS6J_08170 [Burkholderiales bacterium]
MSWSRRQICYDRGPGQTLASRPAKPRAYLNESMRQSPMQRYCRGMTDIIRLADIASIDRLLQSREVAGLMAQYGRPVVTEAIRAALDDVRSAVATHGVSGNSTKASVFNRVARKLERESTPPLRRVFNLTGTVLHTNLGRALLRTEAAFRALPAPVVGRVHDGAYVLDLRRVQDAAGFVAQLDRLRHTRETAA